MTLLLNVRTVTINEFNSQDYPQLHFTSETLTWDPTTTLYGQQENAMTDYSGNIVCDAAVRGQVPTLIVNELQLLTTDMADMMHDCNFHQILTSYVFVSSIGASLSGHVQLDKTVPMDDCPRVCKEACAIDYAAGHTHLLEPHACTTIPNQ